MVGKLDDSSMSIIHKLMLYTYLNDLAGPHFGHEEDYENKEPKSLRDKMLKQDEGDSFGSTDQFQVTSPSYIMTMLTGTNRLSKT